MTNPNSNINFPVVPSQSLKFMDKNVWLKNIYQLEITNPNFLNFYVNLLQKSQIRKLIISDSLISNVVEHTEFEKLNHIDTLVLKLFRPENCKKFISRKYWPNLRKLNIFQYHGSICF